MKRQFKKLDGNVTIPERATKHSAGYDISASETVTIQPDEIKMVSTGLAVQLGDDEVLKLYDRSVLHLMFVSAFFAVLSCSWSFSTERLSVLEEHSSHTINSPSGSHSGSIGLSQP